MRSFNTLFLALASLVLAVQAAYWMEQIPHQGLAPYAGNGYTVFRNVKDYGARGRLKHGGFWAVDEADGEDQVTALQTTRLPSMPPLRLAGTVVGKDAYVTTQASASGGRPLMNNSPS